jgi:hypothetical protein
MSLDEIHGEFTSELDALAASAEWPGIGSYHPSSPFDEIPLYARDSDVAFFEMSAGTSPCARFVESALGTGGEFRVHENFSTRGDREVPVRVYVQAVVSG